MTMYAASTWTAPPTAGQPDPDSGPEPSERARESVGATPMQTPPEPHPWRARIAATLGHAQHRNAYYLLLNNILGAATGLLFWFLLARLAGLDPGDIGLGFSIIALGTIVGVLAKGGLDTALVRSVPQTGHKESLALLGFSVLLGSLVAAALTAALWISSHAFQLLPQLDLTGWALVATIGVLLVTTWLQDAHFLGAGDARPSFHRNLVFSTARIVLPLPLVLLAVPDPVASTWALALALSAVAALLLARRLPLRPGRSVARREFLRSALRNVSGSAAEFLPGLLLAPLVLAIDGPTAAGHFGIAWTAATLLFLASAAISRSALAEMVRSHHHAAPLRRAAAQHLALVLPGALATALLAPWILLLFGTSYAAAGATPLVLLSASVLFVAPAYLYLAYLRATERPATLILFPLAMILTLALLAPLLEPHYGLPGVALAWLLANAPFGTYAALRLRSLAQEVNLPDPSPALRGPAHAQ